MRLEEINILYIGSYVYTGFMNDDDLIRKYHTVGGTLEKCVQSNINNIKDTSRMLKLKAFSVLDDHEQGIGFTVVGHELLYSFGINGARRSKENVLGWFDLVKKELKQKFQCVLWDRNTRAIEFLIRNGMKVYKKDLRSTFLQYE